MALNIQDYDDLVARVAKWLKRQDLSTSIPDFIQLAEEYFDNNNDLVAVNARRTRFVTTPTDAVFPLPSDCQQPIQAYYDGQVLDFFPLGWESQYAGGTIPKIARGYQIIGNNISLSVAQLSSVFQLDYYRTLEGLSTTNESNWLLEDCAGAYLAGTLYEGFGYVRDFEKAEYWKNKRDEALANYIQNDISSRYPAAQMTIRAG